MKIKSMLSLALEDHRAGRLNEAEGLYLEIINLDEAHTEAWHLSGAVALQQGRYLEAIEKIGRAIALFRSVARYHNNMSEALRALGRFDESLACSMRAIVLDPNSAEIHYNIGLAFREKGEADIAIACWQRSIALAPNYGDAFHRLAMALEEVGEFKDAISAWQGLLRCSPENIDAHNRLGNALTALGRRDEAVAHYQHIIEQGDYAWAHHNLAFTLCDGGAVESAIVSWGRALELAPDFAEAHNGLGTAYLHCGFLEKAITCYLKAVEIKPAFLHSLSNVLVTMPLLGENTASMVFSEAKRIGRVFELPFAGGHARRHGNEPSPCRRLKIGYLTPSLTAHVLAPYIEPVLRAHRREAVEVYVYAHVSRPDSVTHLLMGLSDHWTFVHDMTDDDVERRIRSDGIDILIDPMGHWANNRLSVFARKPAPIQVSYLCQGATTGIEAMDYLIADSFLNEGGSAQNFATETVIELQSGFQITHYEDEPIILPPPSEASGIVTFGSCNNPNKISTKTLELWAGVLNRIVLSRLLIKGPHLQHLDRSSRLLRQLEQLGISSDRVDICGVLPDNQHMDFYNRIDISLDTTPFTGGRTTLDSLWMGVPVISLIGPAVYGRYSYSHLCRIGHPELCARSSEDFAAIAVRLASDPARLRELRSTLRPAIKASSLFDADTHTRELEAAFRSMWGSWCDGVALGSNDHVGTELRG